MLEEPSEALAGIAACQGAEAAFVTIESALHLGTLSRAGFRRLTRNLPAARRRPLLSAGSLSGSGTESIVVFRLRNRGLRLRQQAQIGEDRVDLLIGDRLIVEIDSSSHHVSVEDSQRDARTGVRGYRTLRFHYRQVVHEWPAVERAILAAVDRGDHRFPAAR